MITSIDTNVLFDLFRTDSPHHSQSRGWLRDAYDRGAIIVCDLVYAEVVPEFADKASLDEALREIGAHTLPHRLVDRIRGGIAVEAVPRGWWASGSYHHRLSDRRPCLGDRRQVPHTGPGVLLQLFP